MNQDAKQKEEDKQKQDDTFKNDTGQDAPEGWTGEIEDEDPAPPEGWTGSGSGTPGWEDISDTIDPTGGELITDGKINGMD